MAKLNEIAMTPEVLKEVQHLIIERVTNMGIVVRNGSSPTQCLMAEICVIEAKLDAMMMMMELAGFDFTDFNTHLLQSCKSGRATAVNLRQQMNRK